MPLFQHEKHPEEISVIFLVHGFVLNAKLIDKILMEITSLPAPGTAQSVEREIVERLVLAQPDTIGKTESVLRLRNDFRRQDARHSFFEQIAEFGPSYL